MNDSYSIYQVVISAHKLYLKRKEHGSLMHWPVEWFQIDLFYFMDPFIWFQMIYMSSSLFKDNLVKKVELKII